MALGLGTPRPWRSWIWWRGVREAWRKKNVTLGVFIDLKKAFNTVDHRILLAKWENYGVSGVVLGLLGSYLRNRTQYVVYNGG
jgi:hypothetical protein